MASGVTQPLAAPVSASSDTSDELTRGDRLVGTTGFMALEQLRGREALSPAVDVFAFGMVAWQLLTGARPWSTPAILQVAHGSLAPLPSLHERCAGISVVTAQLIESCLSKDPAARPTADVLSRLQQLTASRRAPVSSCPSRPSCRG